MDLGCLRLRLLRPGTFYQRIPGVFRDQSIGLFITKGRVYELFAGLDRLDFVKCDVEGFEFQVFSNMQQTLAKHLPLIQTELNGDHNRYSVIALLEKIGYQTCVLSAENELKPCLGAEIANHQGDFYFKPLKNA